MINFELYKVFYHVASNLNFSQAADRLFITQSAVSQSIKILEQKLNVKLFYRHTKQVQLTAEGKLLFNHIEQAYGLILAGERSIEQLNTLQSGQLTIAASDTICKHYLLPYLKKFMQLYPKIQLRITNRTSPICMELLRKGSADVSVVNLPVGIEDTVIDVTKLKTLHDIFVASDRFTALKNTRTHLNTLQHYPLLLLEKHTITRQYFDEFLQQHQVKLVPEVELGSVELLIELAKIGLGLAFVPQEYVQTELTQGNLFALQLQEIIPERHLGVITNKKIPLPRAAKAFIELLG